MNIREFLITVGKLALSVGAMVVVFLAGVTIGTLIVAMLEFGPYDSHPVHPEGGSDPITQPELLSAPRFAPIYPDPASPAWPPA
jgi:hypothetical protein